MPKRKEHHGKKPKMVGRQYGYSDKDTEYRLECRECGLVTKWFDTEREAVESWNNIVP